VINLPDHEAWDAIGADLEERGYDLIPRLLDRAACEELAAGYDRDEFRSTVVMARHGFGSGEYRYYSYPFPNLVGELREALYGPLVGIANRWQEAMGSSTRYPTRLSEFLDRCHAAGQSRPTPLILKYGPGDYNCLHQDVYGENIFPIQVAILLSDPARFTGGEFILTEQRPRRQSRAEVIPLEQGDAVVFPVRDRPVAGTRGYYRVQHRHGVSTLRSGRRFTLGVIFHDAA
jgi:hypothetical protein